MKTETPFPNDAFENSVTRALEHAPETAVPVDFAARVRASLPPQPVPRRAPHAGRTVAMGAAGLLGVALFILAPHTAPTLSNITFDVELLVLAQLFGITYWLAAKQGSARD